MVMFRSRDKPDEPIVASSSSRETAKAADSIVFNDLAFVPAWKYFVLASAHGTLLPAVRAATCSSPLNEKP